MRYLRLVLIVVAVLFYGLPLEAAGCAGTGSCYWILGTGNANSTANWATTSGGGVTGSIPTAADDCILDSLSSATAYTWTVNAATACKSLSIADPLTSGHVTMAGSSTLSVAGSVTFVAGTVRTYTGTATITGTGGFTSNSTTGASNWVISGSGITVTLKDDFSTTGTFTLTQGTLDAADSGGNHKGTSSTWSSNNSNVRTYTPGTAVWRLTAASGTVFNTSTATNLVLTTTPTFELVSTAASGRTITPGASCATAANFNITNDVDVITISASRYIGNLDFTGHTGSWANAGTQNYCGSITLDPAMTVTASSGNNSFVATSGTQTITSNGVVIGMSMIVSGVGGAVSLADNLNLSTNSFSLTGGTFLGNGKAVTLGAWGTSGSSTRAFTPGTATWTSSGSGGSAWIVTSATNLTSSSTGLTVNMTSASAKTFAGGSLTWGNIWDTGGGVLTITGSNTFSDMKVGAANTVILTSGTTQTAATCTCTGTAGNLVTIGASSTTNANIALSGSAQTNNYMSISKVKVTPGSMFNAGSNSTDGGNNGGIDFPNTNRKPLAIAGGF